MAELKSELGSYFEDISTEVMKCYGVAEQARKKGLDPLPKVEIPIASSLAEKCVGLISVVYPQVGNDAIAKRILELEAQYGQMDPTVSFKIAEEVSQEKFCKFEEKRQKED